MRLIDADELEKEFCHGCQYEHNKYVNCIDCAVANAPTIDAVPVRHGHWILKERKGTREVLYQCSECNAYDLREIDVISHYCRACGAKMDGRRREE